MFRDNQLDKKCNMRYHSIVMYPLRIIAVMVAAYAQAAFCAHGPAAPKEASVSKAGAGMAAHTSTNGVPDAVSTNGVAAVSPHQALIDAWKDVENSRDATPLKAVSLPVSHYPDGSVRILFHAKDALLPKDEKAYLRAKDIFVEMFAPPAEGSRVEGVFLADNCMYDRVLRDGYSEGWIRLQYRNVKIVGTNMTWNLDTRKVKITGGSHVTIESGIMKGMGRVFKK